MKVQTNNFGVRNTDKPATPPPAPPTPPPQQPDPQEEKLRDQILENILTSPEFTKQAMKRVARGDTWSVNVEGRPLVTITSEGPSTAERVISGFRAGVRTVTDEVSRVVDNDPAFMLRNAATMVKTQVYNGISSDLQTIADKALIPFARTASLALDSSRCYKTWKSEESSVIDKGIDTLHVASDVVGLVGAIAPMVFPALAPHADKLLAVGFAGDIVSYSYRGLQYFNRRSEAGDPPAK